MSRDVDAVIAALKVALSEAETSTKLYWKVRAANRWIDQLPHGWFGLWRHLKLAADLWGDEVYREEFVAHTRATIAYLETNRETIQRLRPWSWSIKSSPSIPAREPIDADFTDVTPDRQQRLPKAKKAVRVIK